MKTPEMSHIKYGFYGKKNYVFQLFMIIFLFPMGKKNTIIVKKNP